MKKERYKLIKWEWKKGKKNECDKSCRVARKRKSELFRQRKNRNVVVNNSYCMVGRGKNKFQKYDRCMRSLRREKLRKWEEKEKYMLQKMQKKWFRELNKCVQLGQPKNTMRLEIWEREIEWKYRVRGLYERVEFFKDVELKNWRIVWKKWDWEVKENW